jgi:hypothetical protein
VLNGQAVPTFPTFIRNTSPGSVGGIPGISLPAGMTKAGLPVGIERPRPRGAIRKCSPSPRRSRRCCRNCPRLPARRRPERRQDGLSQRRKRSAKESARKLAQTNREKRDEIIFRLFGRDGDRSRSLP